MSFGGLTAIGEFHRISSSSKNVLEGQGKSAKNLLEGQGRSDKNVLPPLDPHSAPSKPVNMLPPIDPHSAPTKMSNKNSPPNEREISPKQPQRGPSGHIDIPQPIVVHGVFDGAHITGQRLPSNGSQGMVSGIPPQTCSQSLASSVHSKQNIADLKHILTTMLEEERFEEAAVIRDTIRAMGDHSHLVHVVPDSPQQNLSPSTPELSRDTHSWRSSGEFSQSAHQKKKVVSPVACPRTSSESTIKRSASSNQTSLKHPRPEVSPLSQSVDNPSFARTFSIGELKKTASSINVINNHPPSSVCAIM